MFSFTFGLLVLDRTERNCINQSVYYLELSNTWYKGIKTVKYYAFPTVFGDLIGIFFFLTYISGILHTWFWFYFTSQ